MESCFESSAPSVVTTAAKRLPAPKIEQPHAADALRPGTCLRCGCRTGTAHATPNDCIDALRAALADVWSGEVRRIGRPSNRRAKDGE